MKKIKAFLYGLLESNDYNKRYIRYFRFSLFGLIFLNVLAVILETVEGIARPYSWLFHGFEVFSVIIFTAEYLIRLWVCPAGGKDNGPIRSRITFALKPLPLIDLLAIVPFYLPMLFPIDLRFMRALRLIRIFRILKLGRYSKSLQLIVRVFKNKKEELLITIFTIGVLLIIASSLMYFFEHEVQPDKFSSIPATMWWAMMTLTTVGYGDVYPITVAGKFLGSALAILGVGIFALPAAILASAFSQEINRKDDDRPCPHCGKSVKA